MVKTKQLFREVRKAWFFKVLYQSPPEREWETEEAELNRLANNHDMQERFDVDTEALLSGEDRMIAPRCSNDLGKVE